MRRALWVLPVVLLGLAAPAHAGPITVSSGQVLVFNFDFAGVVPPPPYQFVQFNTNLGSFGAGDHGMWTAYDQLNGAGSVIWGPFATFSHGLLPNAPVFSMVLSVESGSFSVDPLAYGYENGSLITDAVAPLDVQITVPEPATLAFAFAGLAAAGVRRRRRARG